MMREIIIRVVVDDPEPSGAEVQGAARVIEEDQRRELQHLVESAYDTAIGRNGMYRTNPRTHVVSIAVSQDLVR